MMFGAMAGNRPAAAASRRPFGRGEERPDQRDEPGGGGDVSAAAPQGKGRGPFCPFCAFSLLPMALPSIAPPLKGSAAFVFAAPQDIEAGRAVGAATSVATTSVAATTPSVRPRPPGAHPPVPPGAELAQVI